MTKKCYLLLGLVIIGLAFAIGGCGGGAKPEPTPDIAATVAAQVKTALTASAQGGAIDTPAPTAAPPTAPPMQAAPTIAPAPPTSIPTVAVKPLYGDIIFQQSDSPLASSIWLLDSRSKSTSRLTDKDVVVERAWFYDANRVAFSFTTGAQKQTMLLDLRTRQSTSLEASFTPPQGAKSITYVGKWVTFMGRFVESNGILSGWGIYLADANSGTTKRLVDVPSEDVYFGLDPALGRYLWWIAGDRLQVVSTFDGTVFFEEPEGVAANVRQASFSSTGMSLFLMSNKDGPVLLNMGSKKRTPLATLGKGEDIFVTRVTPFSDDGQWLPFTASDGSATMTWAVDTESLKVIELSESGGDWFVWSRDGRYVAYKTRDGEWSPWSLRLAALFGDPLTTTEVEGDITDLVWSPVRPELAFGISADGTYTLLATGQPVLVAKCDVHYNCYVKDQIAGLTWSPDGNRLMFIGMQDPGWGLYTVNTDGSQIQKLVQTGVTAARWRPGSGTSQ